MRSKKKSIIAAALISCIFLTACQGNTQDSAKSQQTPAQKQQTLAQDDTQNEETEPQVEGEKRTVTMWSWFDKNKLIPAFHESYPYIEVEFVKFNSSADVATKVQMAVASGGELPDIVAVSYNEMGTMWGLDIWEDLSAEPYNLNPEIFVPSLLPMMTDASGRLVGICEKPGITGIGYKRELAKEYFGTDDPDEMEQIFSSYDIFIEKGKEVRDKSNGTVYMFPTVKEVFDLVYLSGTEPYLDNDTVNLEAARRAFEFVLEMKKEGLVDTMEFEGPAHDNSLIQKKHIFGMMPAYFPTFKIKNIDKEKTVKWGLMTPPEGGVNAASNAWAIPKAARNKDAAFKWLSWFAVSDEGTQAVKDIWPTFSPVKKRYEEDGFYSMNDEWFGGQDIFEKFSDMTLNTKGLSPEYSKYLSTVQEQINIAIKTINASKDGSDINLDELFKNMEEQIIIKEPDIKIQ